MAETMEKAKPKKRRRWRKVIIVILFGCAGIYGMAMALPLIRQHDLHQLAKESTRLQVRSGGLCHRNRERERVLFTSEDQQIIAELAEHIKLEQSVLLLLPVRCACCGSHTFEFYHGETLLAGISLHHNKRLRWPEKWMSDANLTDEAKRYLEQWIATPIEKP
jgi:hypothetical protein